jgi:DNA repair exonuclease SbcCD ATPase subunit
MDKQEITMLQQYIRNSASKNADEIYSLSRKHIEEKEKLTWEIKESKVRLNKDKSKYENIIRNLTNIVSNKNESGSCDENGLNELNIYEYDKAIDKCKQCLEKDKEII